MAARARRPVRVIIADDQELQREGYRMVIESQQEFTVVGEAADGAEALAVARSVEADVVLMDIQMPRVNGIAAAELVAADERVRDLQGRPPRVILLTAVDLDQHLPAAATAGVFAVLFKDIVPPALFEAIRAAAAQ